MAAYNHSCDIYSRKDKLRNIHHCKQCNIAMVIVLRLIITKGYYLSQKDLLVMLQAIELETIVAGLKRFGHRRLFHRETFDENHKVHQIITPDERVVAFWNAAKKQWVCNNQTALINPRLPITDPTNATELTVEWIEQVKYVL